MKKAWLVFSLTACGALGFYSYSTATTMKLKLGLIPIYESNVFHSAPDSSPRADLVQNLDLAVDLKKKLAPNFELEISPSGEFNFYTTHSQRDKFHFGSDLKASWKLSKRFSVFSQAGAFRRKKDLLDDAGEPLPRSLRKWVTSYAGGITKRFGSFKSELLYIRELDNFDESTDTNGNPLRSYDHVSHILEFVLSRRFAKLHTLRFTYQFEFRDYKERLTRSINSIFGSFVYQPREHRQHYFDISSSIHFGKLEWDQGYDYSKRIDSYQNFYGYDDHHIKSGLGFEYRSDSKISATFRYKTRSYPNYWTSRIGLLNRVWIHWHDFEIKLKHSLSPNFILISFFQNYKKTSNDITYEYTDNSFGVGLELFK